MKNSEFEGFKQDSTRIERIDEIQSPRKEIMPKIEKHSAARTEKNEIEKNEIAFIIIQPNRKGRKQRKQRRKQRYVKLLYCPT